MDISHKDRDNRRQEQETAGKAPGVHAHPPPTCGTCGRACLPDVPCYGCEADRHLHLLAQAIRERDEGRAQAEALAEILNRMKDLALGYTLGSEEREMRDEAIALLARLPAQALAERRALEAVAKELRRIRNATRHLHGHPAVNDEPRACCSLCDTLAALDLARKDDRT